MIRLATALLALSRRERVLMALALGLVLPAALWLAVAEPLLARRDAARAALAEARDLHGWVLAQRDRLAGLPAPAEGPPPEGPSGIEARLAAADLTPATLGAAVELAESGAGALALRFGAVDFAALMAWLDGIEAEAGYRLVSLTLTALDAPGQVSADLRLEPQR